jgi:hypothetical protein
MDMKSRKIRFALTCVAMVAATVPLASPGHAGDTTTVTIDGVMVSGSEISVGGLLDFGADATAETVLSEDAPADATVKGVGLDLGTLSVRTDIAAKKLIWTLTITDAPASLNGGPPATGYLVPIMANGDDRWRWLAAGNVGANQGKTTPWTGVCHNEASEGTQGPWDCPTTIEGSVTAAKITWTQRFSQMKPAITFGSTIEPSSIHGGVPASMAWPAVYMTGGSNPIDTMPAFDGFTVPGGVTLAIAKAGVTPPPTAFTHAATFNSTTKRFSGSVPTPKTAGNYTVWAQTCIGNIFEPTCSQANTGVTI